MTMRCAPVGEDFSQILSCILDVGQTMLTAGSEVNRVEDTMERMARAYGCKQVDVFTITSSIVVAFYMYILRFFNPIQTLAEQFDMLQRSFASAEKIFTILDMVPEVGDEEDAIDLPEIRGEIEFKDVTFTYDEENDIFMGKAFDDRIILGTVYAICRRWLAWWRAYTQSLAM